MILTKHDDRHAIFKQKTVWQIYDAPANVFMCMCVCMCTYAKEFSVQNMVFKIITTHQRPLCKQRSTSMTHRRVVNSPELYIRV